MAGNDLIRRILLTSPDTRSNEMQYCTTRIKVVKNMSYVAQGISRDISTLAGIFLSKTLRELSRPKTTFTHVVLCGV